jgi:hypothetical protein
VTREISDSNVLWVVAPCSLADVYRRFRGAYCLHRHLVKEAVTPSETLVSFCQTTRRHILIVGVGFVGSNARWLCKLMTIVLNDHVAFIFSTADGGSVFL